MASTMKGAISPRKVMLKQRSNDLGASGSGSVPVFINSPTTKYDDRFNAPVYPAYATCLVDRFCVIMAQVTQWMYFIWRWYSWVNMPGTLVVSLPFILAETVITCTGSFVGHYLIWNQMERPKLRLNSLGLRPEDLPSIDVFIPCYNEPVEIVRASALAAMRMDYPSKKVVVYILDDGNSSSMRAMVTALQAQQSDSLAAIRYIARKKTPGVPHHAKAGNINNALLQEKTSGELIVIFDCDMVCKPHFLQAIIPHFFKVDMGLLVVDEKIAFIQSPQYFSNIPAHDPMGQQYPYFYGPTLRGWDCVGTVPCCGTNVVFSRAALTSIGGFTYGSITEDFLTSMSLHAKGFESKYVNEVLATGLAPENVHDFFKQRFRWAAGGLEIFIKNKILFREGLKFPHKLLYFWSGFNTTLSIPMVYVICCPIMYLLSQDNIKLAMSNSYEYLLFFMPMLIFQVICMKISFRGIQGMYIVRSLRDVVFMLFCYVRAVLTVCLGVKLNFKVTNKEGDSSVFRKDLNWVIPHIAFLALGAAALASGTWMIYKEYQAPEPQVGISISVGVSATWLLIIMWQMWPPIAFIIECMQKKPEVAGKVSAPDMA